MDKEDICLSYGHVPTIRREYKIKIINGVPVRSKRRSKMYICTRCGARDV